MLRPMNDHRTKITTTTTYAVIIYLPGDNEDRVVRYSRTPFQPFAIGDLINGCTYGSPETYPNEPIARVTKVVREVGQLIDKDGTPDDEITDTTWIYCEKLDTRRA
jgi:hypothetical protein